MTFCPVRPVCCRDGIAFGRANKRIPACLHRIQILMSSLSWSGGEDVAGKQGGGNGEPIVGSDFPRRNQKAAADLTATNVPMVQLDDEREG